MFKLFKISLLFSFTSVIVYLIYDSFIERGSFELYIYWLVLVDLLCFVVLYKESSRFSLYSSFVLFIISAIGVILGFKSVGEFIMRLSFTLLLVGYVQSLIEFKNTQ